MVEADIPKVYQILNAHLSTYKVHINFSEEEIRHFLLPQEGVVFSYCVDSEDGQSLSDFCSFYALPSSVLHFVADTKDQQETLKTNPHAQFTNKYGNICRPTYDKVNASYSFYNVTRDNDMER